MTSRFSGRYDTMTMKAVLPRTRPRICVYAYLPHNHDFDLHDHGLDIGDRN